MSPYASALIAFLALLFAFYQWKKSTGRIRVDVSQLQDRLYIRITSDTPSDVSIDAIGYLVARGRYPRARYLFSRSPSFGIIARVKQLHNGLFLDLGAGWMEASDGDDRMSFNPLRGPGLPAELERYHGTGWHLSGNDRDSFGESYYNFFEKFLSISMSARIRFIVRISGHPRRTVYSRWIEIKKLSMLEASNGWLRHKETSANKQEPDTSRSTESVDPPETNTEH